MTENPRVVSRRAVVVTGAASGIGYATAELFRGLGDTVYGLDIVSTVPDGVTYLDCNVAERASVRHAIGAVGAAEGRIDVLANVAGVAQFGRFDTITDAEWDRVHAIDLKGPFMTIQEALPYLRACAGNVVNVSSVAGRVPQGYTVAYSAAKGGLTQLTRSLALELAPENIRVNAVCPGTVDTPLVAGIAANFPTDLDPRVAARLAPMLPGPAMAPAEVAASIAFLASPDARMMTGAVLAQDGGMS
ncbi:MAG: SDR family oxidoreductase [Mycobacteriaceae bacterium]|nr:SDR family oxidoreductase [Mycobacteriaceae bacterium]